MSKSLSPFLTVMVAMLLVMAACTPSPEDVRQSDAWPEIYPDYTDVWIPSNIAPLNFMLRDDRCDAIQVVARQAGGTSKNATVVTIQAKGRKAIFDTSEWHDLIGHAGTVEVAVTARISGEWVAYKPFLWHVVADQLDPYLTYRLIEPDYEIYQNLTLRERCIESFDERAISDYGLVGNRCMNCHTYGSQSPDLSMLYIRGEGGGAILNQEGKLTKLNIKTDDMVSGSVYFGFNPSGRYITFSSNVIIPAFHAQPHKRLEVYDSASDVYIADLESKTILRSPLLSDSLAYETFPTFSPDGHHVYYCAAPPTMLPDGLKQMRYNLCRIAFDETTGTIGNEVDTLYNGRTEGHSVCHPRISPDGRWLVYTIADYGTFPIWHTESDLQLMDLRNGHTDPMTVVNSRKSDTYHSWSSNSRWLVFASKRDDGLYGKPYFTYIDSHGKAHKPFVLPQRDPEYYDNCLKSFNAPELGRGRLPFDAYDVKKAVDSEVVKFK